MALLSCGNAAAIEVYKAPTIEVYKAPTIEAHQAATIAPAPAAGRDRNGAAREHAALIKRGNALFAEQRYAEAVAAYSQAIEVNPNNEHGWFNRGLAYANLGESNLAPAWQDFSRVIELNPRNDHAFYNRAIVNKHGGREQNYLDDLGTAAQLGNAKAQAQLSTLAQRPAAPAASPNQQGLSQAQIAQGCVTDGRTVQCPSQMQRVEVAPMKRVELAPMKRVEVGTINRYEATQPRASSVDAEAERRGKVIDPKGQGLNQAQIDAMERQRQLMWNATGGGMVYR